MHTVWGLSMIHNSFAEIHSSSAQSLHATYLDYNDDHFACPGQQIIFTCETRGSSIIAWKSEEFIGSGGAQTQFIQTQNNGSERWYGDTVATLVDNRIEGGIRLLVSTLRITAMSMYPNPSVTCIHTDDGNWNTTTFRVIGKHFQIILCMYVQ